MLGYRKSDLLPHLHPQWGELDLFGLFRQPFVYLAIGYSNSILAEFAAEAGERLWERARTPGGALDATKAVISAVTRRPVVWTHYEIFRDGQPQTEIDRAQYTYWLRDKQGWGDAEIERDWQLVLEIKALMQPEDLVIHGDPLLVSRQRIRGDYAAELSQYLGGAHGTGKRLPSGLVHRADRPNLPRSRLQPDRHW